MSVTKSMKVLNGGNENEEKGLTREEFVVCIKEILKKVPKGSSVRHFNADILDKQVFMNVNLANKKGWNRVEIINLDFSKKEETEKPKEF